jgi:hypothetical protein
MDQQFWWRLHRVALVVLVCHDLIQQRRISGWDGGLTGQWAKRTKEGWEEKQVHDSERVLFDANK